VDKAEARLLMQFMALTIKLLTVIITILISVSCRVIRFGLL